MSLDEYRRKRRPGKTPEPFSDSSPRGDRPSRFVIQRHAARRLHYDFRLERNGALASWAVPKGIPLRKGERHLAVHVEDHPLEYGDFEGVIPAGEYGAGTVEIWDRGTYELLEEKRDGGLTVELQGERLEGVWTLVPAKLDGDEKNWLLLRKDAEKPGAARYRPMLATSTDRLPAGEGWVFEPKWDGFRAIVRVAGGEVGFTSRNGNDLTERFRDVARAAALGIRSSDAVLDGEICALDESGRSRFSLLQEGGGTPVLVVFDLLELESDSLADEPLAVRRERLEALIGGDGGVVVSPQFDDGPALLAAARQQELEGVVAKRTDSPYRAGRRSLDWQKLKLRQTQEVVIAGYTRGQGRRTGGFGALVAAVHDAGVLRWAGNIGTGFSDREIARLLVLLDPLATEGLAPRPGSADAEGPGVGCRLGRAEARGRGGVRRVDARGPAARAQLRAAPRRPGRAGREARASTTSGHDEGARTRASLLQPRQAVLAGGGNHEGRLDRVLPRRRRGARPAPEGRPFTMKRYPDGWQGKSFFQKNAPSHMPEWIERAPFPARPVTGEKRLSTTRS